jgi:hypothetical protein
MVVAVVLARVVEGVLVDEVDDVRAGTVELVQAASVMVRTTITAMPTLRTVLIVSPICYVRESRRAVASTSVRVSRLQVTRCRHRAVHTGREVCGGAAPRSDCNIHGASRDLDAVWPRDDRESVSPA